jgi:ligand-binding sensor domain-containing protein/uncharacterized membrane-anchored protein YhcB (DUF1043 family)
MKTGMRQILFALALAASSETYCQHSLTRWLEIAPSASQLQIQFVREDSSGFLWLGTNQGVLRYNGKSSAHILWPSAPLQSSISMLELNNQTLIVGYETGEVQWKNIQNNEAAALRKISDFPVISSTFDEDGNLWIGTNGDGLYRIHGNEIQHFGIEEGMPDVVIHCLLSFNDLICAGTDLGLCIIEREATHYRSHTYTNRNGLPDNLITCLSLDDSDHLLIGSYSGAVCAFNPRSRMFEPFAMLNAMNRSPVVGLFTVDQDIWTVSESGQLWITRRSDPAYMQQISLGENQDGGRVKYYTDAIRNKEGLLILALGNHQLLASDQRTIFMTRHEGIPFDDIRALTCDSMDNIWFSSREGLFRHAISFSDDSKLRRYFDKTQAEKYNVISIAEGPDKGIWLGTFGYGLGRLDPESGKIRWYTESDGLLNNNVLSITEYDNALWLATLGGLCKVSFDKGINFTGYGDKSSLGSSYVYTVFAASDGALWIGTDGHGAVRYRGSDFEFIRDRHPDAGRSIVSITSDAAGRIWMNGPESGLQVMDGDSLHTVHLKKNNLPVEVLAFTTSPEGQLVLFTNGGIARLSWPDTSPSFYFHEESFTTDYLNVITKDVEGKIWCGSTDAIVRLATYESTVSSRPSPKLEQLEVMFQPIDTAIHSFAPDENHFTFRIAGIWFQNREEIHFSYFLEGYDRNWNYTQDEQIIYSRLNPGDYTFHLRCFEGSPSEQDKEVVYHFSIRVPVWQTWWFISQALIFLLSFAIILTRIRIRNLRKKEAIQKELFQSQFETLRNQVNPHFLFNSFNTLVSIIDHDKKEAIEYVEQLSEYFRLVLQQRDKEVITVQEELEQVKHYFFIQKKRFGENLQIEVHINPIELQSLIPPMTLQILCENAVKHNIITSRLPLRIRISTEGTWLEVRNNLQPRPAKESGTGVGIANIRSRYHILFGKEISSGPEAGDFVARLPIVHPKKLVE